MESLGLDTATLALVLLGLALGLRHGIDWDHIVAIADITGSTAAPVNGPAAAAAAGHGGSVAGFGPGSATAVRPGVQAREGFVLAFFYALGHASLVIGLGLLAIWAGAILPEWIDPLMERVVGLTLIILGLWIIYSLWRFRSAFQLRSRWMLVLWLVRRAWVEVRGKLTGRPVVVDPDPPQYGRRTAFGIGMIHGVGAETGSQALLLASVAGATSGFQGTVMLVAFTLGLLLSNSLVAAFSVLSFVSAALKRNVYVGIGAVAGVFSLLVGILFLLGLGADLPDLQELLSALFGPAGLE